MAKHIYVLPEEFTIYEVEETYRELQGLLEQDQVVELDASHVADIDSAGFQLMVWLARHFNLQQVSDVVVEPSEQVSKLLELLSSSAALGQDRHV